MCLFSGRLGETVREGAAFRAEILGLSAVLNAPSGRVCQRLCDARLGDARCGVSLAGPRYTAPATVLATGARGLTMAGLGGFDAGWFSHGSLQWADGRMVRIVAHWVEDGVHHLSIDRPDGAPGDACTVVAGCDRHAETCRRKFDNILNFRGFPHLPGEDWALTASPEVGGVHDGGARS